MVNMMLVLCSFSVEQPASSADIGRFSEAGL